MNIYKLLPGEPGFRFITPANYAHDTQKSPPWYQLKNGRMRHYAVCPACDNPIQLIGITELVDNTATPYGKHVPASIPGLASYDREAHKRCPLAAKNRVRRQKSERKL